MMPGALRIFHVVFEDRSQTTFVSGHGVVSDSSYHPRRSFFITAYTKIAAKSAVKTVFPSAARMTITYLRDA